MEDKMTEKNVPKSTNRPTQKTIQKNNNVSSKKNKHRKNSNSDIIAILFIFAIIILFGIGVSVFKSSNTYKGIGRGSTSSRQEKIEEGTEIIIAAGAVSVVIAGIYIGFKISKAKKRKRILEEKLNRKRELEEARKKVERSKYEDILAAGKSVINDRRKYEKALDSQRSGIRHKYDLNSIDEEYEDEVAKAIRGRYTEYDEDEYENKIKKGLFSRKIIIIIGIIAALVVSILIILLII